VPCLEHIDTLPRAGLLLIADGFAVVASVVCFSEPDAG
jgi:hypothetical protein